MEKKKVFKVLATYSEEASLTLDAGNVSDIINSEVLVLGRDWDIKEFDTKAEADAYIQGILDANGWIDPNAVLL
jgi:hypothetical protein